MAVVNLDLDLEARFTTAKISSIIPHPFNVFSTYRTVTNQKQFFFCTYINGPIGYAYLL